MKVYTNISPPTTIPDELRDYPQWVCWRWQWSEQRWEKVPVDPQTGYGFDYTDSTRWHCFEDAVAGIREDAYDGIGFVLTPQDPFSFVDLDGVRDPKTGEIEPWSFEIVDSFDSFTEVSPSGQGLHIIVRGQLPGVGRGKPPIELFVDSGYVTVTGNTLPGYETIHDRQEELESLVETHIRPCVPFSRPKAASVGGNPRTASEVLEKARNGQLGSKFKALEAGDISVSKNDTHVADNDYMMQLAFYTGKDPRLMESLFSESVLGLREKWTDRPDYRRRTIDYAIKHTHGVYDSNSPNETKVRDKILEELHYAMFSHNWCGRADAAATDYFGYKALLRIAYKANTLDVNVSLRRYMEKAGIARHETAAKSLARLENKHGLVKKVRGGDHKTPARYRIRVGSKVAHIEILKKPVRITYALELIPLKDTHLVPNPSPQMPDFDKNGGKIPARQAPLVNSVGKSAAMVLDIAHAAQQVLDGPVPLSFVADRLKVSEKNLKARQIRKLLSADLLQESENGYSTPDDIQERLQQELLITGCHSAGTFQRSRHDKERRVQVIKRLAFSGRNRYEILHETGYDWDEIAALVPEVVDTYPVALEGHIDTLERHIVKGNVVYVVAPPSEMDTPGRHELIFLDERRRIDLPGKVAA